MHFCAVAARVYGRLSKPRNTSLNWFMPALVNSSVGSSPGTTGLDGTTVWPFASKKLWNWERISEAFMGSSRGTSGRSWRIQAQAGAGGGGNHVVIVRGKRGLAAQRQFHVEGVVGAQPVGAGDFEVAIDVDDLR